MKMEIRDDSEQAVKMPFVPKCTKCHLSYNTRDVRPGQVSRSPLLLHCGHTFCSDCLGKLLKQQSTHITCPTCQVETSLTRDPGTLKSLWLDVHLFGLIAMNKNSSHSSKMDFCRAPLTQKSKSVKQEICEECNTRPATCKCLKCEGVMCGVCFDKIHQSSNMLKQHQATPLVKQDVQSQSASWPSVCDMHERKPIEFYCEDDDLACCSHCVVKGSHRGHSVVTIEEKNKKSLADINRLIHEATTALNITKKSYQLLHSLGPTCRNSENQVIQDIQGRFHFLHSLLQTREHMMCDEILAMNNQHFVRIQELQGQLADHLKSIDAALADARLLAAGHGSKIQHTQVIMDRLQKLVQVPCYVSITQENSEFQFEIEEDTIINDIKTLRSLVSQPPEEVIVKSICDVPDIVSEIDVMKSSIMPIQVQEFSVNNLSLALMQCNTNDSDSLSNRSCSDTNSLAGNDNLQKKRLPTKPPKMVKHKMALVENVIVSHIRNPWHFFVQRFKDVGKLTALSRDINIYCNTAIVNKKEDEYAEGDMVLAKFTQDNIWYRAQIQSLNSNLTSAEVLYVDYGNLETISMGRILPANRRFLHTPHMAKVCSLVDIVPAGGASDWSKKSIEDFARMTTNKTMLMTVIADSEERSYVDLSRPASDDIEDDGPASIRDALVFLDLACWASKQSLPQKTMKRRDYIKTELPQGGTSVRAAITHVVSPGEFYIQMKGDEHRYLTELMAGLQKTYSSDEADLYTLFCPAKGMLCVAQFSMDKLWYRAEVVGLAGSGMVDIRYVDFGNIETISVWKLKKLIDAFIILPAQAVPCCLADVKPAESYGGNWGTDATEYINELISEIDVEVKVKDLLPSGMLSVYLHKDYAPHSVNTLLVANNWAMPTGPGWEPSKPSPKSLYNMVKKSGKASSGSSRQSKASSVSEHTNVSVQSNTMPFLESQPGPEVIVSHIVSPGEFYVQDINKKEQLNSLMADIQTFMNDFIPDPSLEWKQGVDCLASSPGNRLWYRASVLSIDSSASTAQVFFLDFGSTQTVPIKNLFPLNEQLRSSESFAIKCHLSDIIPAGDISKWSSTACEAFQSLFKSLGENPKCYLAFKDNEIEDGSVAIDLFYALLVKGGALTPDATRYISFSDLLREKGLALRRRPSKQQTSPPTVESITSNGHTDASTESFTEAENEVLGSSSSSDAETVLNGEEILEYPPFEFPEEDTFFIGITHVDKNGQICGQEMKKDLSKLTYIMQKVDECYKRSVPLIGTKWSAGQLVVARFPDDEFFYRAKIISLFDEGRMAEVLYIDYGNREVLSTENIRPALMRDVPSQCLVCELDGIVWDTVDGLLPDGALSTIRTIIAAAGSALKAEIKGEKIVGSVLKVELFLPDNQPLSRVICDKGLAVMVTNQFSTSRKSSDSSLAAKANEEVQRILSDSSVSTIRSTSPMPVDARASVSASAIVITSLFCSEPTVPSIAQEHSTNSSVIPPEPFQHPDGYGDMNADLDSYKDHPTVADPKAGTENEGNLDVDDGDAHSIVYHEIPERLVASPYIQLELPEVGDFLVVNVTQVDLPDQIYIQRGKIKDIVLADPRLEEINRQIDRLIELSDIYENGWKEYPLLKAEDIYPGQACIAQCSIDDCWYRAEILSVATQTTGCFPSINILFVDFGSTELIINPEKMRAIPDDHMSLPAQAARCRIADLLPADGKSWNPGDASLMAQLLTRKSLLATVRDVVDQEMFVELYQQKTFMDLGVSAPLAYQDLIDNGFFALKKPDSDMSSEEKLTSDSNLTSEVQDPSAKSWDDAAELED